MKEKNQTSQVTKQGSKYKKWLIIAILVIIAIPILFPQIFLALYIFIARPFQISGDAMYPNFKNGEYYMTNITDKSYTRGDVIVHKSPDDRTLIKRIVAVPVDTIMLKDGVVYVNGSKYDESKYLSSEIKTYGGSFLSEGETVIVPPDSYFVLGDNRPYSSDSREWGFVKKDDIISTVTFCYWNCRK